MTPQIMLFSHSAPTSHRHIPRLPNSGCRFSICHHFQIATRVGGVAVGRGGEGEREGKDGEAGGAEGRRDGGMQE